MGIQSSWQLDVYFHPTKQYCQNHQLCQLLFFLFVKRPLAKKKKKNKTEKKNTRTHNWQNLCETDAHESVSVMEISQTPGSHVRCLLYIDLHCV